MGGRAPRRAEGGGVQGGGALGFWERNPVGGTISPFNIFRQFLTLSNTLYHQLGITHGRENRGDRGTIGKGMANNDRRLGGTKWGKSVYERSTYLRTELVQNH